MITVVYEYKIAISEISDYAISEMARKMYSTDVNTEGQAAQQYAINMTEEDTYWINKYLRVCLYEICTKLQPLQKYLDEPFQVDSVLAALRLRLPDSYNTCLLEGVIQEAIGNYICWRWFKMKGLEQYGSPYRELYNDNINDLKGYGVRGIRGNSVGQVSYDIGLGSNTPEPYYREQLIVKDLVWNAPYTEKDISENHVHGIEVVDQPIIDLRKEGIVEKPIRENGVEYLHRINDITKLQ